MHQHYLIKLHPETSEDERRNSITNEIFQILDEQLQGKLPPSDPKNYKKLLAALQKCRIMHPTEISVLFVKANRFLGKDAVRKEKAQIKREVQEKIITSGPKKVPEELLKTDVNYSGHRVKEEQKQESSGGVKQAAQQRLQRYR